MPGRSATATCESVSGAGSWHSAIESALIGVGNMGGPMARCLARAEHPVMLYDTRPEMHRRRSRPKATCSRWRRIWPRSARNAAPSSPCCPTAKSSGSPPSVPTAPARAGFGGSLAKGSVVIDMSSSYPVDTQKLGAELGAQGRRAGRCAGLGRRAEGDHRAPRDHGRWPRRGHRPRRACSRRRWAPCTAPGRSAPATP